MNLPCLSYLFCTISTIVILSGCSPDSTGASSPTSASASSQSPEGAAEAMFRSDINSQSQGYMNLVSLKKLDGESRNAFGCVEHRRIRFEAAIQFTAAGTWLQADGLMGRLNYQIAPTPQGVPTQLGQAPIRVSKDNQVLINGLIQGRKTDNGWQFNVTESGINPGQINHS